MIQSTAIEADHGRRDSNTEAPVVGSPYDYLASEQMAIELPQLPEFPDDYPRSNPGDASRPHLKDEYLERLATLSSTLFKQLTHINSRQTAESSYFTLQPSSALRSDFPERDPTLLMAQGTLSAKCYVPRKSSLAS